MPFSNRIKQKMLSKTSALFFILETHKRIGFLNDNSIFLKEQRIAIKQNIRIK